MGSSSLSLIYAENWIEPLLQAAAESPGQIWVTENDGEPHYDALAISSTDLV